MTNPPVPKLSDVVSEPVRSPADDSVRGWVRQHTDRAVSTDFGIVVDVGCFLAPTEARELARVLDGVADEYEGRRMYHEAHACSTQEVRDV